MTAHLFPKNYILRTLFPCILAATFSTYIGHPALAQSSGALTGDRLLVGTMDTGVFKQIQSLPLPSSPNRKFCGLVQLAPGLFSEAYVPTAAERAGDFSAFAGLLLDPHANFSPFPGGIIPASRIPNPWAWRISSGSGGAPPDCATFPASFVPFSSVSYTSAQIGVNTVLITSTNFSNSAIAANSGDFTLIIRGRGLALAPNAQVVFNGTTLTPSTNVGVQLTVSVPNKLIASTGTANVSVVMPTLNISSNTVQIPIAGRPGPFLNLGPDLAGSAEIHLTAILGSKSETRSFSVRSSDGSPLSVQLNVELITSTTQNWLKVSPDPLTAGASVQTINYTIDTRGLEAKTYFALIRITATIGGPGGLSTDIKTIAVEANITGSSVLPSPGVLSFTYVPGGLTPSSKPLSLIALNLPTDVTHTFTAAASVQSPSGGNWLSINPRTGNLPGVITVTVNPSNLPQGTYWGQISITWDIGNGPVIVDVAMNVRSPNFRIDFSPYRIGGALPSSQTAPLSANPDPSGFYTDSTSERNWLTIAPLNGETPQTLLFTADPVGAGLTPGTHVAYTTAIDQLHPDNVYVIAAFLNVTPAPTVNPLALTTTALPDGTVDQPYTSPALTATGGSGSFTWTIPPASLPLGLNLNGAVIRGTPTVPNVYTFPVTVTDTSNPPLSANKTLSVTIKPAAITGPNPRVGSVRSAASEEPFISPNSFIEIKGTELANITADWSGAPEFAAGRLPTSVRGVTVTVNGKPSYVSFVSPGQINALAPVDPFTGDVQVTVTNNGTTGNSFTVPLRRAAPAFFEFDLATGRVAATHADNAPVAPVGTFPNSRPAAPNEIIQFWATGFGDTNPPIPDGQVITAPRATANAVTALVGGANASVDFAGLVGPGLYQINVRIPPSTPDGDAPVKASIPGAMSMDGVTISVRR